MDNSTEAHDATITSDASIPIVASIDEASAAKLGGSTSAEASVPTEEHSPPPATKDPEVSEV